LDLSTSIDFTSDMDDYSELLESMGMLTDYIIPTTDSETVAYQPEIIDFAVSDSSNGSPLVDYDKQTYADEIEVLTNIDDFLSICSNNAIWKKRHSNSYRAVSRYCLLRFNLDH